MLVTLTMAEEAAKALELYPMDHHVVTAETIQAAYKRRARETHPDAPGGSAEAFVSVDKAKHILLVWLQRKQPPASATDKGAKCPTCDGSGFIWQASGFKRGLKRQCAPCHGTGEVLDLERGCKGD